MQKAEGPRTPFEVYCHHCKVTFPVGAKRCVHCGNRLGREKGEPVLLLPPAPTEDAAEDGSPRRGFLSPMTPLWVVLAMAGMYRACTS